jgi:Xaa-Pro dipeptidase
MNRRNFIRTTGAATALTALSPLVSCAHTEKDASTDNASGNKIDPAIVSSLKSRIKPITPEERAKRIEKARELMGENKMDVILMEGGTSLEYFSGAKWGRSERLFAMVLTLKDVFYISPKFEESRAKEQTGNANVYCWEEHESPYELIKNAFKELNLTKGTIGIEETTRYFVTNGLRKAIPELTIVSADAVTAGCRSIKTQAEIDLMQIANEMTAEVFKAAVKELKVGMTQNEYGQIITRLHNDFGVWGGALVLFGESSALPHGTVAEVKLKEGDVVLMDGGCGVEGYQSDITRMWCFGKPTDKMKKNIELVRKAQDAGLKAAKSGVEAQFVDAAARQVIIDAGYGPGYKFFTHRLGHGIGLDGHEWHYLVGGNKHVLKPGNMFSNEPGIYIRGEFGIRLEDEMLITDNGAKLLLPQQGDFEKMF